MPRHRLQEGTLIKDGKWWRVRWYEEALDEKGEYKRTRRSAIVGPCKGPGSLSRKEAKKQAWDNIMRFVNTNAMAPSSMMTVGQFIAQKFEPEVVWALKEAGKAHYGYCFKKLLPTLGDKRLRDLTVGDVQKLMKQMIGSGLSVQTATHVRNAVHSIIAHAKRTGYFSGENPASLVRLPQMTRRERYAYNWSEAHAVLNLLPSPVKEAAFLSMTTSLNVAELMGLRRKRVNLSDDFTTVGTEPIPPRSVMVEENFYLGKYGTVKTTNRRRIVPLPAEVLEPLRELMSRSKFQRPDDPVFTSRNGTPLDAHNISNRVFKKAGKKLGFPVTWHTFRHTAATLAKEVGMPKSDRVAMMGHGSGEMTDYYTHSDLERRREFVMAMAKKIIDTEPVKVEEDKAAKELERMVGLDKEQK